MIPSTRASARRRRPFRGVGARRRPIDDPEPSRHIEVDLERQARLRVTSPVPSDSEALRGQAVAGAVGRALQWVTNTTSSRVVTTRCGLLCGQSEVTPYQYGFVTSSEPTSSSSTPHRSPRSWASCNRHSPRRMDRQADRRARRRRRRPVRVLSARSRPDRARLSHARGHLPVEPAPGSVAANVATPMQNGASRCPWMPEPPRICCSTQPRATIGAIS